MLRCWPHASLGAAELTVGGGSGDRDDDDGEAVRVTNALYRVPVPEELEPWATYPAPDTEFDRFDRKEGDWVKIEYTFPTWIVGTVQQVELV